MTARRTAHTLLALLLLTVLSTPELSAEQLFKRRKKQRVQTQTEAAVEQQNEQVAVTEPEAEECSLPVEQPQRMARTPHEIDSLTALWRSFNMKNSYDDFFRQYIDFAQTATPPQPDRLDSVYAERLRALMSPIPLPYNYLVRQAIDRYTGSQRSSMTLILSYAQHYFPMIEQELIREGLPVELRSLAVIESALKVKAVSRMGAAGLWQFMPSTGKSYGLEVNSMVDERYDPLSATRAACRYMKEMYAVYGDWLLAIASYNCGPGNVNKAIAKAGGDVKLHDRSFWDIYEYLPPETRGYVPAFIGATYAYAYHALHGISYDEPPMPIAVDTVMIGRPIHLEQISSTIDVSIDALRMLNPQYKLDIIPATTKQYCLVLPTERMSDFICSQEAIRQKDSLYLKEYLSPANIDKKKAQAPAATYHIVKKGDTLGAIARKYHVTQKQLMSWNNLKNADRLSIGQRIKVSR
ncbi:MAG: transglycosylase SLT domain-containing protein [Alistipes sp.]|nr:transglycosylase SLT domain-containing protein [Alistipes sp.]